MNTTPCFNKLIEQAIVKNWEHDALTDYQGETLQYRDVARKIEKLHIVFEESGIRKGDRIALCGRNSSNWGVAFLATLTYGAVAVPILHEFTAEQVHNIVNHSEARLLFVGDVVAKSIDAEAMPELEAVIYIPDYSLLMSRSERVTHAREHLNEMFGKKYPKYFRSQHVNYHENEPEELALINYTSGTTGFSKGVMLPYRALWGNLDFAITRLGATVKPQSNMVSILPMAHMYGMAFEFIFPFCHGIHLYFLNRLPSPTLIAQAYAEVKPSLVIAVPLIIEKIIRKRVFPKLQNNAMRLLLNTPIINRKVKQKICELVYQAFGGKAYEIIIGGAALSQEVEQFLMGIDFPVTVGYGTTECAPLICYTDHRFFRSRSCGQPIGCMECRIDSPDPENVAGEILTRGTNLMLGYYKNEEATRQAIDADGWYHTGDLGTMDSEGFIYIRGRSKNMLLSANGQNIYPEEIEDQLNSMAMVSESIVIQKDDRLIALVYPDMEEVEALGFSSDDIFYLMEENRIQLNQLLPPFSKIAEIRIQEKEFAKTPKKSIKRYLYQS